MKRRVISMAMAVMAACFFLSPAGFSIDSANAREYEALKGVKSVNTVFDFRDGKPENALVHLKLVHDTFKDQALKAVSQKPDFVVVFMGPSVMLLSNNREKFSPDEKKQLEEFDGIISAMAKDGVRLEVCLFAVSFFKLDPGSIAPEIKQVDNGWIASLGYQQKDYSLVPVF